MKIAKIIALIAVLIIFFESILSNGASYGISLLISGPLLLVAAIIAVVFKIIGLKKKSD